MAAPTCATAPAAKCPDRCAAQQRHLAAVRRHRARRRHLPDGVQDRLAARRRPAVIAAAAAGHDLGDRGRQRQLQRAAARVDAHLPQLLVRRSNRSHISNIPGHPTGGTYRRPTVSAARLHRVAGARRVRARADAEERQAQPPAPSAERQFQFIGIKQPTQQPALPVQQQPAFPVQQPARSRSASSPAQLAQASGWPPPFSMGPSPSCSSR